MNDVFCRCNKIEIFSILTQSIAMFLYQEHANSELLVIQLDLGDYQMTYHHMEHNGHEMVAFTQNRRPNNNDRAYLNEWIEQQYEQYHVMNLFRDSFRNCIEQDQLQVNRRH